MTAAAEETNVVVAAVTSADPATTGATGPSAWAFLQIGLLLNASLISAEERTGRDDDTFLRMIQANNRSLRDIDGDRLWKLSSAKNEVERRQVHSADRLRSRQMYLESELLAKQIDLQCVEPLPCVMPWTLPTVLSVIRV